MKLIVARTCRRFRSTNACSAAKTICTLITTILMPITMLGCSLGQASSDHKYQNATNRANWLLDLFACSSDTIRNGESLFLLLTHRGFSPSQSSRMIESTREVDYLARNYPGEEFETCLDERGELIELRYDRLNGSRVVIAGASGSFVTRKEYPIHERTIMVGVGEIESSLYQGFMESGLNPELVLQFADVFAWTVDFLTECRTGDTFGAIFSEDSQTGRTELLAACYQQNDTTFIAVALKSPDGRFSYYAPDGANLRKAFLRSPLNYRRISSGFTLSRYHPIRKVYRPHLGVDYAAASGTPVVSIGDGVVRFAGWKGGFGNYIEVKHAGGCVTTYGHLRKFGKGVRKGIRVAQGQVIGYVGSTGLSTGPHLDYRILLHGRPINPLRFAAPPAPPLERHRMPELSFRAVWAEQALSNAPIPGSHELPDGLEHQACWGSYPDTTLFDFEFTPDQPSHPLVRPAQTSFVIGQERNMGGLALSSDFANPTRAGVDSNPLSG